MSESPSHSLLRKIDWSKIVHVDAIPEAFQLVSSKSLSTLAAQTHNFLMERAPHALFEFEELATVGKRLAETFSTFSYFLLNLNSTDRELASGIANSFVTECLLLELKEPVTPEEVAEFLLGVAKFIEQISEDAEKLLEEFKQGKPNELAALVLFPRLTELKPHEFMGSLRMQSGEPNLTDPGDYVATLFVALCLGRKDIVSKAIHFRLASELAVHFITHRYTELGGEQWVMESTGRDYLSKGAEAVYEASFFNGEALRQAQRVIAKLEPLLKEFEERATKELEESKRWDEVSKPVSLDIEIEGENGEISTLSDMIIASPDLEEAMPQLLEIWESLEADKAKLLTMRFIEGKSLSEIAVEKGWNYDQTQKRIERLVKEFLVKMSD